MKRTLAHLRIPHAWIGYNAPSPPHNGRCLRAQAGRVSGVVFLLWDVGRSCMSDALVLLSAWHRTNPSSRAHHRRGRSGRRAGSTGRWWIGRERGWMDRPTKFCRRTMRMFYAFMRRGGVRLLGWALVWMKGHKASVLCRGVRFGMWVWRGWDS
ncbi:hypothetical protein CC86DRAFT_57559 [Ophiobolus disseminans]|uniref:Uncharacterized protein n=1 Tax=Ophiobolus disseminans TaxID=1469910 RepID=A0A6A6ZTH8_9PLEO|nr:hypothetical protein CC86DRAFT_57559 [Ophiobolus disseminans]